MSQAASGAYDGAGVLFQLGDDIHATDVNTGALALLGLAGLAGSRRHRR